MARKFWCYLKGWRGTALICYMWFVLMAYAIVYIDVSSFRMRQRFYVVTLAKTILLVLIYICPRLLARAERLTLKADDEPFTMSHKRKFFVKSWAALFMGMLAMYITFYPGTFGPDVISQYLQATGAEHYNDWHPTLHTLFAFTLPLKLSGGWLGSVVLFQIIVASLAIAYMLLTLAEYGMRRYTPLILLYLLVNPAILGMVIAPTKDVQFAVFAMLSMICAVRVYFSCGEWLKSWLNVSLFVLFLTFATIFRHNAILFTFPLILAVVLYAESARKAVLMVGFCAAIFAVKGVLYPYLGTEKPGYRVVETIRLPLTIIQAAAHKHPNS